MQYRYPNIHIFYVDRDSGELRWSGDPREDSNCEEGNTMAANDGVREEMFKQILTLISHDANLCNYVRYMDYGKIITKENIRLWESIECCLNEENRLNQTQIIRFVNNLDSKFFISLSELHNTFYYDSYSHKSNYGILPILRIYHADNTSRRLDNTEDNLKMEHYILERSINIDFTLKMKGLSLTLLDFVNKNIKCVRVEKQFFQDILYFVNKLIFVGDKCHLLAITDVNDNIYVNLKCLENIYKMDVEKFKDVVLKLFKVANKICIYFANNSIVQYIKGMVVYPILTDIYKKSLLMNVDGNSNESEITPLSDFNFTNDEKTNDSIKTNIKNIIEDYTCKYLNSTCNIDSYDIPGLVKTLRENYSKAFKDKLLKSFMTGLNIHNVCAQYGWEPCTPSEERISGYFHADHVYIKKTLNFIPTMAFVYMNDRTTKRVLKDSYIADFSSHTGINVKTIYLDVTTGTMMADAKHPNVSGYSVCMGDIKGKISFIDASKEHIGEMLSDCEALLTAINYTSPYNHDGESYFKSNESSYNFGETQENDSDDSGEPKVLDTIKSYDADDEFSETISDDEEF